jgi:hypothetical protein
MHAVLLQQSSGDGKWRCEENAHGLLGYEKRK